MSKTCQNWLGLVNNCIYYACHTYEIYQVLSYSVDFKAPGEIWNPLSKTVLSDCSLFGIKDLETSKMTVKLKSNFYFGLVNVFPNFWHWDCPIHVSLMKTLSYDDDANLLTLAIVMVGLYVWYIFIMVYVYVFTYTLIISHDIKITLFPHLN